MQWKRNLPQVFGPLVCVAVLLACVLIAWPVAEIGIGDDWSYIYSAKHLAESGRIAYNGWGSPILGWLMFLGAFFIKCAGFSFTVTRMSVFLLALVVTVLLQRIMTRLGINDWNATVGTLVIVLSPLFLGLVFNFTTDIPSLFCVLLCLYSCIRALQSDNDATSLWWLAFAAVANVVDGTVRQIAWLGVLVMVPSTAWLMRKRRGALMLGGILWLAGVALVVACLHWFASQPYSVPEKLIDERVTRDVLSRLLAVLPRNTLAMCLYLSPVFAAFALHYPFGEKRARARLIACMIAVCAVAFVFAISKTDLHPFLAPFSGEKVIGNNVNVRGLFDYNEMLGTRPTVLHLGIRILITIAVLFVSLCFALTSLRGVANLNRAVIGSTISWRHLFILLGPFTLAYVFLLMPRAALHAVMYDRYLLPLLVLALPLIIRLFEERVAERLPVLCLVVLLPFAAFGVIGLHDGFALYRARVRAIDQVRSGGIPRIAIQAGWDYDGWTQIEATGYVNESRMRNPPGAYQPISKDKLSKQCPNVFASYTPSLRPNYVLSYDPRACAGVSKFSPVTFSTWFAPHHQVIYVVKAHEANP